MMMQQRGIRCNITAVRSSGKPLLPFPAANPDDPRMASPGKNPRFDWRRAIALAVSLAAALAALVALRGPDALGTSVAETVGAWWLSGPAFWHPLAPTAFLSQFPFFAAGPRGWQNAHVAVAWLALACSLFAVPAKGWRGLGPLIPALWAAVLSTPVAGLTGFGWSVLVLSVWRVSSGSQPGTRSFVFFPLAVWIAAWFSPGALPVAAACFLSVPGNNRRLLRGTVAAAGAVAACLTPRGLSAWSDAWIFFAWDPQRALVWPEILALLGLIGVIFLVLRPVEGRREWGAGAAAVLLLLAASRGQTAYLWAFALLVIPLWPRAREGWRACGVQVRWWMETALLVASIILVLWAAAPASPRWYSLAMTEAVVRPTMTRDALGEAGPVYINSAGRPLARFTGPLPAAAGGGDAPRLGREPALWRAHDRAARYRAVWLLGEKSDYAPLAQHLGQSPDWRLAAADATGVLFLREPREEVFPTEPAQQMAREMWGGANRSAFLARTALACLAAGAQTEAGELSQSAVRNSDRSAQAAAARARVLDVLGDLRDAVEESARATKLDPTLAEAWQVRAEALLQSGRADEAYAAAQKAVELAPADLGARWLAARTANAARAFQSEALILEELIAQTRGRGGDDGFYQLFLGQSYARQGLSRPALRALEKAAAAPGVTAEQRAMIEEEIAEVKKAEQ